MRLQIPASIFWLHSISTTDITVAISLSLNRTVAARLPEPAAYSHALKGTKLARPLACCALQPPDPIPAGRAPAPACAVAAYRPQRRLSNSRSHLRRFAGGCGISWRIKKTRHVRQTHHNNPPPRLNDMDHMLRGIDPIPELHRPPRAVKRFLAGFT